MPDIANYNNSAGVTLRAIPGNALNPSEANQLIPALRRQCVTALGTGVLIPEALPDFLDRDPSLETNPVFVGEDIALPLCVIVAGKPSYASGYAVNDHAITIPIDFVYVMQEQAGVDNPQLIRAILEGLAEILILDYRQLAGTGVPSCNDTNLVATPLDRQNEYQKRVMDLKQSAQCGVLSIECVQIRNPFYGWL